MRNVPVPGFRYSVCLVLSRNYYNANIKADCGSFHHSKRLAINYDDRFGTAAIVIALFTATLVNFALRIEEAF